MSSETSSITPVTKQSESDQTRQRSTISFPYTDLGAGIELTTAIHTHVGLGDCEEDQMAVWTDQSPKSSAFREQIRVARMAALLDKEGAKYKLAELGRAIVDPNQTREAKTRAFLNIPLFKAVFDKYRGGVMPPAAALERDMVGLGVSEKQKDRARQVLERSADQAGFFEHGKNRLVMPGVQLRESPADEGNVKSGNGNGGDDGGRGGDDAGKLKLDQLLIELLKKIPAADKGWPAPQRIRWFKTFAMVISQIYDAEGEPVEIDIKVIPNKAE